jgi:hypothetical protein
MPLVGFEPTISAVELPQTYALDRAATEIGVSFLISYIKMNVCLFVCMYVPYTNSHFWTVLNQTLHTSPPWSGRDGRVCMGPGWLTSANFWALIFRAHYRIMGTRWLPARPFSAILLYPWFQLVFAWRHGHYVIAGGGVIRGSLISVILAGFPLKSRKLRRSRRQSHPPQRRIPYPGGCSRHVTDSTFKWAAGPSPTALHPSFHLLFLWPTDNHVLPDDSCAFLLQACCTLGNAYGTLGREQDPCVYNSEPHQTGRQWLRNCNYTNNV